MTTARDRPPEEAPEDTSFARGLRVFLTIADRGLVRADELATLLDTPLSTVYRYLRTLTEFGFVDRRDGAYQLGPRLLVGGGSTVSTEQLIRRAEPILTMLAAETRRDRGPLPACRPGLGLPASAALATSAPRRARDGQLDTARRRCSRARPAGLRAAGHPGRGPGGRARTGGRRRSPVHRRPGDHRRRRRRGDRRRARFAAA